MTYTQHSNGFLRGFMGNFLEILLIDHSLITAVNHNFPFEFIWMDLRCTIKESNALFLHFIIDKTNTKPIYYIRIDSLQSNIFMILVKSLVIIILYAKYLPQT